MRSLVRLFHIEDDYFIDDINQAEKLFKELNLSDDAPALDAVSASVKRVCKCCCIAHSALSVHSVSGHQGGCHEGRLHHCEQRPGGRRVVIKDKLYSVITSLETKFDLQ